MSLRSILDNAHISESELRTLLRGSGSNKPSLPRLVVFIRSPVGASYVHMINATSDYIVWESLNFMNNMRIAKPIIQIIDQVEISSNWITLYMREGLNTNGAGELTDIYPYRQIEQPPMTTIVISDRDFVLGDFIYGYGTYYVKEVL